MLDLTNLKESLETIAQRHPGILAAMITLLALSLMLLILSLIQILPVNAPTTTIGYGDIGGYRAGSWLQMLAFPVLALIFGVVHNFIAIRLFNERGATRAKLFLWLSIILALVAFIILLRVTGGS